MEKAPFEIDLDGRHVTFAENSMAIIRSVHETIKHEQVASVVRSVVAKMSQEVQGYLTDLEIAVGTGLVMALKPQDVQALPWADRLLAYIEAWQKAEKSVKPAARKGLRALAHLVSTCFKAESKQALSRFIAHELFAPIPLEHVDECGEFLVDAVQFLHATAGQAEPKAASGHYLDTYIFHQVYLQVVQPFIQARGRVAATKRLATALECLRVQLFE